ncbi:hypothetical protein [Rubritalea sp.]|uniref:hypothetical protein n=1 Tax=Rubritalea sp. TaxID=2109375 RepID=UPI003EF68ADD
MKKFITLTFSSLAVITFSSCTNDTTTVGGEALNPVIANSKYPDAHPVAGESNKFISPYRPYNVINVKGVRPGLLVRDISTAKTGANGKPDLATAKIFRIPAPTTSAQ